MTPTSRSLEKLRNDGYYAQVVEKWNSFAKIRIDLFGGIDILAVKIGIYGCLGIQTTSTGNINARVQKLASIPAIKAFLLAGNRLVVWGWAKRGPRGSRKTWTLKEREIKADECVEIVH